MRSLFVETKGGEYVAAGFRFLDGMPWPLGPTMEVNYDAEMCIIEDPDDPYPEQDRDRLDTVNAQILDIHDIVDWALGQGYLEYANRPAVDPDDGGDAA